MTDILNSDIDAQETSEWLAALADILEDEGSERAQFILEKVMEKARVEGVNLPHGINTNYVNTIPASQQPAYPGDLKLEQRIRSIIRWKRYHDCYACIEERFRLRWSHGLLPVCSCFL